MKNYNVIVKCTNGNVNATVYAESQEKANKKVKECMRYTIYKMGGEIE